MDKIIVFDLECACWYGRPPEGMYQDIIEIGFCVVNMSNNTIGERRSILVKPPVSDISPLCTKITNITQEMVDTQGVSLKEACRIMEQEYGTKSLNSVSWGKFDHSQLLQCCDRYGIEYPLGESHSNAQKSFMRHVRSKNEISVNNAIIHLGMEFDGAQHRAADDAYNTAVIVVNMNTTKNGNERQ